jgi:hypothetical protein
LNIDRVLANLPDDDDDFLSMPQSTDVVRLDNLFENVDHGLSDESDADSVIMKLPRGRIAKTTRSRMKSCTTSAQLRELDRELYLSAGLNPAAYGI